MNALMTETIAADDAPGRGWVVYDGACGMCRGSIKRFEEALKHRGFAIVPSQTPWVQARLGLGDKMRPREMRVLTAQGEIFGGSDAVLHLCRFFWWARPLRLLHRLPGMDRVFKRMYRWVADNRYRISDACQR